MEPVKKIKKIIYWIIIPLFYVFGCKAPPPAIDPLVLQEISPIPRSVKTNQVVTEYEPVYSILRIVEVSEVNGVQKFFLVRIGTNRTGIEVGVTGDIGEDASFQKIIGNYKIIELQGDFFRCEIVELAYRIGRNAYIRVKIGEQVKGAAAS